MLPGVVRGGGSVRALKEDWAMLKRWIFKVLTVVVVIILGVFSVGCPGNLNGGDWGDDGGDGWDDGGDGWDDGGDGWDDGGDDWDDGGDDWDDGGDYEDGW